MIYHDIAKTLEAWDFANYIVTSNSVADRVDLVSMEISSRTLAKLIINLIKSLTKIKLNLKNY